MTRQVAERRKHDRLASDSTTPTIEIGDSHSSAVLKNISRTGLACVSYTEIPEMTVVEMKIQLPALPEEEAECFDFACKGAVVRCEPMNRSSSKRKWMVAIFFTEVDDKNQQVIDQYMTTRS